MYVEYRLHLHTTVDIPLLKLVIAFFNGHIYLEPTCNDHLPVGEKFNRIPTLPVQIAEEGILHPTEGKGSDRRCDSDVDPKVACLDTILELSRPLTACRED